MSRSISGSGPLRGTAPLSFPSSAWERKSGSSASRRGQAAKQSFATVHSQAELGNEEDMPHIGPLSHFCTRPFVFSLRTIALDCWRLRWKAATVTFFGDLQPCGEPSLRHL
jgi:hypothetical protein